MENIFANCGDMFLISVLVYLVILMAMSVDLACGIRKAKIRGEYTNSTALSRSVTKFITYEGGLLIATGVDLLIHLGKFWEIFGLDVMMGIPLVTIVIGIFVCSVEWISIREKADEKTKKEMKQAAVIAGKVAASMLNKDELSEALTQAIINANNHKKSETGGTENEDTN
jgi:hypothetical protein